MSIRTYLKRSLPLMLADTLVVSLGLFLGVLARYVVLVGLREAPLLLLRFTTPADLWRESMQAYQFAAPWLTLICLVVFGLSGFYRTEQPYPDRKKVTIVRAASVAFLLYAVVSYLALLLGYLARQWGFAPFPRSALFAGWVFTLGLLLVARKGAAIWAAAREGNLGHLVRNRYFVAGDLALIALAAWLSFFARLDSFEMEEYRVSLWVYLGIALVVKPLIFRVFGLYRRYWHYASMSEVVTIVGANGAATFGVILLAYLIAPIFLAFTPVPRSIPFIDIFLTTAGVGGTRFLVRLLSDKQIMSKLKRGSPVKTPDVRRVLIVGAGDAGAMIVKEMHANPQLGLDPVGFVDDDPTKQRVRIHNVPVLGGRHLIPQLAQEYTIDQVIIAMPTAPGRAIREVVTICEQAGVTSKIVPGVYEIISGAVSVKQLRQVQIEDLLRRDLVITDQAGVSAYVRGTCVMVTGAGGSIGSELCRQLARHEPAQLVLVGHGEFSIFNVERELRKYFPGLLLDPVIADVRDVERIEHIVRNYRPVTIFHAAAHKHVPLMECNVEEAFTNNVLGTQSVLRAAERNGVERFVMVSTDKAVNPTSVMGATKRVAEMLVHDTAMRIHKPFVVVRFGNVMGSRGSVIPIFQEQIAAGGPVTVTHPDMRRFFMTIPEAVQLVLQAAALGKGGEIFMLDMGELVKIVDLVTDLIKLSGLTPGEDIDIVYTGIRPGEKLYEEIVLKGEDYSPTQHDKVYASRNGTLPAGEGHDLEQHVSKIAELVRRADTGGVLAHLCQLVPEFKPGDVSIELPGNNRSNREIFVAAFSSANPQGAVPNTNLR
jgi:FlaA1/EpsC-like NDP-sugar epimerase